MRTALITAIFNGYDTLKPLPANHGFDEAIAVTDYQFMEADGWNMVYEPYSETPRLAGKKPKMRPQDYVDADLYVWVDGQLRVNDGLKDFVLANLGAYNLLSFKHPERSCLYDEAVVVEQRGLTSRSMIRGQTQSYRDAGMPKNYGFWECALLVWTRQGLPFGTRWLDEVNVWTDRDQVALPYLSWKYDFPVGTLPGESRNNPYVTWFPHRKAYHG